MASNTPPSSASHHAPAGAMSRDPRASRGASSPAARRQGAHRGHRGLGSNDHPRPAEPGLGEDRPGRRSAPTGPRWGSPYYALTRPAEPDTLRVLDLTNLYIAACSIARGAPGPACTNAESPAWETNLAASPSRGGLVDAAAALVAGGLLTNDQREELLRVGDDYGVDANVGP